MERPRAHEPRAGRRRQPERERGGVGHRAGRRAQQREGRTLGSGGEASGHPAREPAPHAAVPHGTRAEAHSRALRGRGARHGRARRHGAGPGGHHGRGAEPRRGRPGPGSAARGHEPARFSRAAQHAPRGARGARLPRQRPRALRPSVRGHERLDQRRAHRPHAEVPRHLRGHGVVPRPPGPGPGLDDRVREPARDPQGREPAAALRRARPRRLREGGLRVRRPRDPGARQHGRQAGRAHAGRDCGHRAEGGVVAAPAEGALRALGRGRAALRGRRPGAYARAARHGRSPVRARGELARLRAPAREGALHRPALRFELDQGLHHPALRRGLGRGHGFLAGPGPAARPRAARALAVGAVLLRGRPFVHVRGDRPHRARPSCSSAARSTRWP